MKKGVAVRLAAAQAVERILDDGEHSNVVIDELRRAMEPEDARQLQRIVLAALRHLVAIDRIIEETSGRSIASLDGEVRSVLRSAVAELLADRGDPHGVVDTSVEAVRALGGARASGFVNAVLRRIARERPALTTVTVPEWIRGRLASQWGRDVADEALASLDGPAQRGIRLRGTIPAGEDITDVPGIPGAGYAGAGFVPTPGDVDFIDPASTAVAVAAAVEPSMDVLDVAAAPGGKTAAMWDAMSGEGLLVAADRSLSRLRRTRRRLSSMRVRPVYVVADGTQPPFAPSSFDTVLLDAPCTGLGTLRRRPEIRHRIRPDDPSRLGRLQRDLLEASLRLVRPGGRLVYAVCTLFAEETIDVVAGIGAEPPPGLPGERFGDGLLLAPHLTGTDGMFIAVIDV